MSRKGSFEYYVPISQEQIKRTSKHEELTKEEVIKLVEAYCCERGQELCKCNDKPILWTQFLGALSFSSVYVAIGSIVGFTGVILPALMDEESEDDIILSVKQASIFSSIVSIGAMVGSILASLIITWLGQRSTLLVFLPVGIIFWAVMAFAKTYWLVIVSRFLHGVVAAVIYACAGTYIVETAHLRYRGRLSGLSMLIKQIGYLFIYLVGSSHMSWRNIALVCGITSMGLPLLGAVLLPHSPRWLSTKDRQEEARKSLMFYRGENYNVDSELHDIQEQLNTMSKGAKVWDQLKLLVTNRNIANRFAILASIRFLSQFSGSYAVVAYSVNIFISANIAISPYVCSLVVASMRIVAVCVYLLIADKIRRRVALLTAIFLAGISMFTLSSFFFMKNEWEIQLNWIPLTAMIVFVFFTVIYQSVETLILIELLPMPVRSVGTGLLGLCIFSSNFCAAISYPFMVISIGSGWTFLIYGVVCFAMFALIAATIPETRGKKLEDI